MQTEFYLSEDDVTKIKYFMKTANDENPSIEHCVLGTSIRFWFEPCSIGVAYGVDYKGKTLDLTDVSTW